MGNYISLNSNDGEKRKIIGYGQETGEIRLQEGFTTVPENGDTYKLWTKDLTSSSNTFSQKTYHSSAERKVGGAAITSPYFKIMTSYWNSDKDHEYNVFALNASESSSDKSGEYKFLSSLILILSRMQKILLKLYGKMEFV